MLNLKNLFISFLASVIVMIGCVLMYYFVSHNVSIVSFIFGILALLLLWGAFEFWDKKLKSIFKIEEKEKK